MISIQSPKTRDDFKNYYGLRYRVLREPWAQSRGTEKDDYEPISHHFMAVDDETCDVVGVVKMFEREPGIGWLSHLAVHEKYQRQGIGRQLVQVVEDDARQQGFTILGTMARLTTTEYFEQLGYRITGIPAPYFSTTQVVWMEKTL